MQLSDVICDFLSRECDKVKDGLYIRLHRNFSDTDFKLYYTDTPSGIWRYFGDCHVSESKAIVQLDTVWGIVRRQYQRKEKFVFSCFDERYPENVIELIKKASENAYRIHTLDRERSWRKWNRTARHRYEQAQQAAMIPWKEWNRMARHNKWS